MTERVQVKEELTGENIVTNNRIRQIVWSILVFVTFFLGLGTGYLKWGQDDMAEVKQQKESAKLYEQVNPKDGYALPISYGDLGPRLVESGVIDYDVFSSVMANSGDALTDDQMEIIRKGSDDQVVITTKNAHFLLNFFWAVGLVNRNSILTEGPMVQYSNGQIDRFASTGGWTLATKPVTELYASMDLISLRPEQQARVKEVASAVYRPCCNNHTLFPDCNHGMAMLGLLELMAFKGASVDEMFEAAKHVNAYWFPQQTLEIAVFLKSEEGIKFADAEARLVVGETLSSASGAGMVHETLKTSGLLKEAPDEAGGCTN